MSPMTSFARSDSTPTTTRSGTTGGFSCASAHTVSVRIAGDIPVTARRTVSCEETGRLDFEAARFFIADRG